MKAVTALYFYQEKTLEKFKHYNKLVVDADWVVHAASSAGEKRSIHAVLKKYERRMAIQVTNRALGAQACTGWWFLTGTK